VDYNHLFIRDNSIASFKADFQVFSSVNENAAITIEGAAQNVLGTTVLLGTPTITSVNNSISGFFPATAIGVTADSDRLRIGVTVPQTSYIFGKNTIVDMGLPFNPPPVVLAATGIGQTSFTANWESYPGAVVYLLDVSDDPAFSTFIYEDEQINAPSTSYVVIGLTPNTTYYYRVRASTEPISSFDADYQAVLDYATTQGYTLPSSGQQALQNQLVVDLKDAGIWSKLDTFGVFASDAEDSPGSNTSDFALIDWIRLIDYTAVNSPTFNVNEGFEGNGTSSYIDLNYETVTDWVNVSQDDASVFGYQFADVFPNNGIILGVSVLLLILINPRNASGLRVTRVHSSSTTTATNSDGQGLMVLNRNNSVDFDIYLRGTLLETPAATSDSVTTDLYSMRTGTTYAASKPSVIGYGASLTSTQITDLTNYIDTYITSL
jgi:hypothetical protein